MFRRETFIILLSIILLTSVACGAEQPRLENTEVIQTEDLNKPIQESIIETNESTIEETNSVESDEKSDETLSNNSSDNNNLSQSEDLVEVVNDNKDVDNEVISEVTSDEVEIKEDDKVESENTPTPAPTEEINLVEPPIEDGPTDEQLALLANLANLGTAPTINNELWLNTEPINWEDLRGKVVVVEFWTYG